MWMGVSEEWEGLFTLVLDHSWNACSASLQTQRWIRGTIGIQVSCMWTVWLFEAIRSWDKAAQMSTWLTFCSATVWWDTWLFTPPLDWACANEGFFSCRLEMEGEKWKNKSPAVFDVASGCPTPSRFLHPALYCCMLTHSTFQQSTDGQEVGEILKS